MFALTVAKLVPPRKPQVRFVAGTVQTQDIFRFQAGPNIAPGATDGAFVAQGHVPQFYEELARNGAVVDLRPFATETVRAGAGS